MVETIIVRQGDGFQTYSGWVVNRSPDMIVFASMTGAGSEPASLMVPIDAIVSEVPVAA